MSELWDENGDFDYEAAYEANIRDAAASIQRPDLENSIASVGVADLRGEQFTPRLIAALEEFERTGDAVYELKRDPGDGARIVYDPQTAPTMQHAQQLVAAESYFEVARLEAIRAMTEAKELAGRGSPAEEQSPEVQMWRAFADRPVEQAPIAGVVGPEASQSYQEVLDRTAPTTNRAEPSTPLFDKALAERKAQLGERPESASRVKKMLAKLRGRGHDEGDGLRPADHDRGPERGHTIGRGY